MGMKINLPEPLHGLINGIEGGAVTNFHGVAGTGKTNLCLLACIECARNGGRVVYIDTENGFSAERLKQLAPADFEKVLQRIRILRPKDLKEQGEVIRAIARWKQATDLVVVDSVVALYRLEYAENEGGVMHANKELSRQLSVLSGLAAERGVPVITTAHVYSRDDGFDVIGGEAIKYWSKVMLLLERTGRMSERRATLAKHLHKPEGGSVKFEISEGGVRPSRFRLF